MSARGVEAGQGLPEAAAVDDGLGAAVDAVVEGIAAVAPADVTGVSAELAKAQLARVEAEAEAGRLRESNETLKAELAAEKLARVDDAARTKADADTRARESATLATQLRHKKQKLAAARHALGWTV
jgi:Skp family chaperone for outer membrane proteins